MENRPPWLTNALQRLRNLKTNTYKKYKKCVVAHLSFNVFNSHCYAMYLNRSKFEFSKDPRQFYNFVNAKRKSSALPSSVRLNSIEASSDPEIALNSSNLLIVLFLGLILATLIT